MNESFDIYNLFFLVLAGVVFWRLRSVLGRRTGNERKPYDPYKPAEQEENPVARNDNDGNVITLPNKTQKAKPAATARVIDDKIFDAIAPADSPLGKTLRRIASQKLQISMRRKSIPRLMLVTMKAPNTFRAFPPRKMNY